MRIFICGELIKNLQANINKIETVCHEINSRNYEAYFIYVFALFEGAVCEAIRHILTSFPEKISNEKQLSFPAEVIYKNTFSPMHILDTLVYGEIKKINKGSAKSLIDTAERICSVKLKYNEMRLKDISSTRNWLTHENTVSCQEYLFGEAHSTKNILTPEKCKSDTIYLLDLLKSFSSDLEGKYKTYTKYRLLKELWFTLFDTLLLKFNHCILIRDDDFEGNNAKVVGFNFEYIKAVSSSLSSSEKFYLSMLLQQYSTNINEQLFRFSDIPMLVSIADKKKIYIVLQVLTVYPHLFNGMNLKS